MRHRSCDASLVSIILYYIIVRSILSHDPACCVRCIIIQRTVADTIAGSSCMYDASAADIDRNVLDRSAGAVVEYQISGNKIRQADRCTAAILGCRKMRKRDPEMREDCHSESGTVDSACQAGTAPYIRNSRKLARIGCDRGTACRCCRCSRFCRCSCLCLG